MSPSALYPPLIIDDVWNYEKFLACGEISSNA